jgi:SAM-dependent methyltransferase
MINASLDDVKEFWDSRPCNIKHSTKAIGTTEYFNEVEARKYFVEPHIPAFAEFERWRGKRVLEIGCGIGTDAVNFARAGAIYTGIELSVASLELAKQRFKIFNLEGTLLEGDAENLQEVLPDQSFDLIYSFGVLHHTPSLDKALSQISHYCSADTIVKIMLYASNSWKQKMIDVGLDQPEAQYGCPIANSYSEAEVIRIFSQQGLRVTSFSQDHIFPYDVEEYKKYNYVLAPWFKSMPEIMFRALERSFGWHGLIEALPTNDKV